MEFVLRCEMPVDLSVERELLGKEHKFGFEGREISVNLSTRYFSRYDEEPDHDASEIAECFKWNHKKCLELSVKKLFLTVQVLEGDNFNLTEEMVTSGSRTNHLFWEQNTDEDFRNEGRKLSNIASRAFDYWCSVTRWVTGSSYIGLPLERHEAHPGWRYLASVDPLEYVASFNDVIYAYLRQSVSIQNWGLIQSKLQAGEQTPIWIDIFHEANRRLATGDVRGAHLEAAVSAEALIRQKLMDSVAALPATETAIRKRIENWNMTDVLNRFSKISTLNSLGLDKDQLVTLRSVFDIRNAIMHGRTVNMREAELKAMLKTIKALFDS